MIEQATNGYIEGIDRDKSPQLPNNSTMWNNENFRVITQEGDSTTALSNVKGNARILATDNTVLKVEDDEHIIGHGVIQNDIVLFTVSNELASNKLPKEANIYLYKWQDSTGKFVPRILLYNDAVNSTVAGFNLQNAITVITRHETNFVRKVYWTDNTNIIRYVNIAPDIDDDGEAKDGYLVTDYTKVQNMDIEDFNILQNMDMITPEFDGYASGELYSGMIQFNYRFYNVFGTESMFNNASELIPITADSLMSNTQKIKGSMPDTNCKKSVKGKLLLSGNNLNFDRVEIVSLHYGGINGKPTINVIDIIKIDNTNGAYTIHFEDIGLNYINSLDLSEYREIKADYVCKTLESKDDRLFIGNITEQYFDLDYDARAYRYSDANNTKAVVYMENGTAVTDDRYEIDDSGNWSKIVSGVVVDTGTNWELPEDANAINRYNDLNNDTAGLYDFTNSAGSTSPGATGANVTCWIQSTDVQVIDEASEDGTFYIEDNYGYRDWYYGKQRGYARGEIYRFGVVFYDTKGRQSFVKWIADLRMPNSIEAVPFNLSSKVNAFNLIPKFFISNIPLDKYGNACSYQIVRVKRELYDRTVILTAGVQNTGKYSTTNDYLSRRNQYDTSIPAGASPMLYELLSPELEIQNIDLHDTYLEVYSKYKDPIKTTLTSRNAGTFPELLVSCKYKALLAGSYKKTNILSSTIINTIPHKHNSTPASSGGLPKTTLAINTYSATTVGNTASNSGRSAMLPFTLIEVEDTLGIITLSYAKVRRAIFGYGGNSYTDRTNNTYIIAGDINGQKAIYGDTVINYFDRIRNTVTANFDSSGELGHVANIDKAPGNENEGTTNVSYFPIETSIILPLLADDAPHKMYNNTWTYLLRNKDNRKVFSCGDDGGVITLDYPDLYKYNMVYSMEHIDKIFFPKPFDWQKITKYDVRIRWSDTKFNGEERDSWLKFRANNMQDVDTAYGSLNQLVNFKNNIYAFQENGFCLLPINERALTSGTSGSVTTLGEGAVLPKHMNYAVGSTNVGLQHTNHVVQSLQALYWLDTNKRKAYRFSGRLDSLGDIKGLSAYFRDTLEYNTTFTGIYNNQYAEVMFTFNNTTLVFNEILDKFQGWFTLNAARYIKTPILLLSTKDSIELWQHDVGDRVAWYGDLYVSIVELIVNPNGSITKEFNNILYMSEVFDKNTSIDRADKTLNHIQASNDYIVSDNITLLPYKPNDILYTGGLEIPITAPSTVKNIRRRERMWHTTIPRVNSNNINLDNYRMRDAFVKLKLTYDNISQDRFLLYNINTLYRIADKT